MLNKQLSFLVAFLFLFVHLSSFAAPTKYGVVKPTLKIRSDTVYYKVVATQFELPFLQDSGVSGPFEIIGTNSFLFVSRCGLATVTKLKNDGFHVISQQDLPNASDVFCAGPESNPALLAPLPNKLLYGVKGMKLDVVGKRLFVDTQSLTVDRCLVVKVFEYPVSFSPFQIGKPRQIFSTSNQIPGYDNSNGCPKIESLVATQAGGSITLDRKGNMYFSVGDFGSYPAAQDKTTPYGKIFKYNGHIVSMYAMGVRNPEGLYFDPKMRHLLETEHGPKGGDELNEINQDDNLGWPISSYGIDYADSGVEDFRPLPGEEKWGHHDFGKKPLFVYMPAIAPTDLTVVSSRSMFRNWSGSVLIASLRGLSIFRVLLDDGRGMYSEPIINLKNRIRYLRQAGDGTLYAKADPDYFYVVQLDWPGVRRNDPQIDHEAPILDMVGRCSTCHLHVSHSGIPNISGMKPDAMVSALQGLATSSTANPAMINIAKSLTKDDMKRLAKYFSEH